VSAPSRALAHTLLLASRPVSWINTAFPFAAVWLLTTGRVDAAFVIGTVFFLIPYNLLMYGINDVFDYASDLANPRKGGVEGALLPPSQHRAVLVTVSVIALPFVVALAVLGGPASWIVLAVSLFAVVAYSAPGLRFKEIPFLDSATSSTHFVAPGLYGAALAGTDITPGFALVFAAFFLWGMASHAFGAVQDIVPDRDAGIASIATVLGARTTVRLAVLLWLAAGALMLAVPWPGALGAVLCLPYAATALPFLSVSDDESPRTNRGWKRFLVLNYIGGFLATMLILWWAGVG